MPTAPYRTRVQQAWFLLGNDSQLKEEDDDEDDDEDEGARIAMKMMKKKMLA